MEREGASGRKIAKEQREWARKVREEWNWGTIGGRKKGNDEAVSSINLTRGQRRLTKWTSRDSSNPVP